QPRPRTVDRYGYTDTGKAREEILPGLPRIGPVWDPYRPERLERPEAVVLLVRLVPLRVPVPAALRGRPGRLHAMVLAAAAQHLGTGRHHRLPVEHDGVVLGTDGDAVAGVGARLAQRVLHTQAVQAVGEVTDGLVVVEVGLADPALGLLAPHAEEVLALGRDREARVVHGLGPDDDTGGFLYGLGRAGLGDDVGQRVRQLLEAHM